MTTAIAVMNLALRDAGVLGSTETAEGDMLADAFATFQQMLDLWQIDNLNVYAQVSSSFVPTGAVSYTVGAAGVVAITRPEKIDYAFWRSGTIDQPITILNSYEEYQAIVDKGLASDPSYLFYLPSYPLGTLYLYPKPSTGTVHLVRQERLPTLATSSDTITLPPAYILPIRYSLAELYAVTFNAPINPAIPALAARYRKTLRRGNVRINELGMPLPVRPRGNILVGH